MLGMLPTGLWGVNRSASRQSGPSTEISTDFQRELHTILTFTGYGGVTMGFMRVVGGSAPVDHIEERSDE